MIDHIWSIVCQHSILDRDTNLLSIINVIEELTIKEQPEPEKSLGIVLELTSLWVRSDFNVPGQGFARYVFASPSGQSIKEIEVDIDLTKFERLRSRGQFIGLSLLESGRYNFRVEFRENKEEEWKQISSIPIKVNFIPDNLQE